MAIEDIFCICIYHRHKGEKWFSLNSSQVYFQGNQYLLPSDQAGQRWGLTCFHEFWCQVLCWFWTSTFTLTSVDLALPLSLFHFVDISPLFSWFTSLSIPSLHFLCPCHHSLHLLPAVDARQKEAFYLKGRVVCPGERNTAPGAKVSNSAWWY